MRNRHLEVLEWGLALQWDQFIYCIDYFNPKELIYGDSNYHQYGYKWELELVLTILIFSPCYNLGDSKGERYGFTYER